MNNRHIDAQGRTWSYNESLKLFRLKTATYNHVMVIYYEDPDPGWYYQTQSDCKGPFKTWYEAMFCMIQNVV